VKRVHLWISGRVQGVFFRHEVFQRARGAGLAGWVRNLPDGRVEAIFEGPEHSVNAMVEWCRGGPPGAQVAEVEATDEEPERLDSFEVQRTPR
jgi:acylphosphatase